MGRGIEARVPGYNPLYRSQYTRAAKLTKFVSDLYRFGRRDLAHNFDRAIAKNLSTTTLHYTAPDFSISDYSNTFTAFIAPFAGQTVTPRHMHGYPTNNNIRHFKSTLNVADTERRSQQIPVFEIVRVPIVVPTGPLLRAGRRHWKPFGPTAASRGELEKNVTFSIKSWNGRRKEMVWKSSDLNWTE